MVPKGWTSTKLGEVFDIRREKGRDGLPTLSVTLSQGLVLRDSLDRKTDTSLSPDEHLLVRKGDIAYNMMRMWQGASGLAHFDAHVSPAYVVLKPKSGIDSLFASYFFKSARMIYLFWAYSYGLTGDRLRLYFPDFSIIPVTLPPINEQRRIGNVLATWDRGIEKVEQLIRNSEAQKKSLMQRLLTGKKRLSAFEDREWRTVHLKQIAEIQTSNVDKKTASNETQVHLCNYMDVYYNTHITRDLEFMAATATEREIEKFTLCKGDVIITKDSETPDDIAVAALVEEDLNGILCGYHLALIRPRDERADGAFLNSLFSLKQTQHYFFTRANGATRFGLTFDAIADAEFYIPGLDEQKKIGELLQEAERSITNYTRQLALLKKEKTALMQQLLTGKRRVKVESMEAA